MPKLAAMKSVGSFMEKYSQDEIDGVLRDHTDRLLIPNNSNSSKKIHYPLEQTDDSDVPSICEMPDLSLRNVSTAVIPPGYHDWCSVCAYRFFQSFGPDDIEAMTSVDPMTAD